MATGFDYTPQQLFLLVALPNLVGSLLRVPYTFAVPRFGGRNWTMASAALLLIPTLGFAYAVQNPSTPFWVFCLIAATAGLGGGNFASSMANINFFYPAAKKGAALGLNAAGGNLGRLADPVLPAGDRRRGRHLRHRQGGRRRAAPGAGRLRVRRPRDRGHDRGLPLHGQPRHREVSTPREQLQVVRKSQTWIMAFLYIGTFGSFIGYSAAMPLLIKLNFWVPDPAPLGTGIYFAYFAFLGALVGSLTRPFGGWLADKYGGARVTLGAFTAMVVFTLAVLWTLTQLTPNPTADPAIAADNESWFPFFLGFFLCVFAATGIGNGSTYKMIPAIFRTAAERETEPGTPERSAALGDGHEAVLRRHRHHRRGRRDRRVPHPDRLQLAVGRGPAVGHPGRVHGVRRLLRRLRRRHLVRLPPLPRPGPGDEPGRRRHLDDPDPLSLLQPPVRDDPLDSVVGRASRAGGPGVAGVPGQRGGPLPQGLDRGRAAPATASG